jgi:Domain of unknown function (DUF222)
MFDADLHPLDAAHAAIGAAHATFLERVREADRSERWRREGARDLAHWLSMRYGMSAWKAHRWIGAAHALERLPLLKDALARGGLGIDKVVELCRFATPETESRLIVWAEGVSSGAVRRRADREVRSSIKQVREAERDRTLEWWYSDEGRRFGLFAEMPASYGPTVIRALEREAERIPVMPGEEDAIFASARRVDALVALCSGRLAADAQPARSTVVVHARLTDLRRNTGSCEADDGSLLHPETVRRLLCEANVQTVVEDDAENVLGVGRMSREPSAWMVRQVRYRDRECRFPGCGARRFTEAHHLRWWRHGGRTEVNNLLLICSFHHRLVHEFGWSVERRTDGEVAWFRPHGARYRAGPGRTERANAPPEAAVGAA